VQSTVAPSLKATTPVGDPAVTSMVALKVTDWFTTEVFAGVDDVKSTVVASTPTASASATAPEGLVLKFWSPW
jgi:hypothetical protein